MPYDLLIKNGMVVDGTGFARYRADVAVSGGTIAEIGRIRGAARTTIDADGLFVAPGVIDLHTHYDAQPFWDRLCTSSIWHGVTTVLTGNCGLTLAPLRPEHREAMLATFCCVEDLPIRSLSSVLPWTWESFGEYLDAIDIGLGPGRHPRRDRHHADAPARGPGRGCLGLEHDQLAHSRGAARGAGAHAPRRR
jgi:N-acyl-D-aspartate/D-glutamate deacylase